MVRGPGYSFFSFRIVRVGFVASFLIGSQATFVSSRPAVLLAEEPQRTTLFLYRLCASGFEDHVNWCEGYLMGLADILLAMGNSRIAGGICKAEYQPETLNSVFKVWTERHPDLLGGDMAVSAQAAFREVWPCP